MILVKTTDRLSKIAIDITLYYNLNENTWTSDKANAYDFKTEVAAQGMINVLQPTYPTLTLSVEINNNYREEGSKKTDSTPFRGLF